MACQRPDFMSNVRSTPGYFLVEKLGTGVVGLGQKLFVQRVPMTPEEKTKVLALNILENTGRVALFTGAAMMVYHSLPESVPYLLVGAVGGVMTLYARMENMINPEICISDKAGLLSELQKLKQVNRQIDTLTITYQGRHSHQLDVETIKAIKRLPLRGLVLNNCQISPDLRPHLNCSNFSFKHDKTNSTENKLIFRLGKEE